jgi:hypothetical protein
LFVQYDRIDPVEVQALKDEIEQLKLQKEKITSEQQELFSNQTKRVRAPLMFVGI